MIRSPAPLPEVRSWVKMYPRTFRLPGGAWYSYMPRVNHGRRQILELFVLLTIYIVATR